MFAFFLLDSLQYPGQPEVEVCKLEIVYGAFLHISASLFQIGQEQ